MTMPNTPNPTQIVQRQLDAFNAKDIDALLRTYNPDAEHFALHGELLARGHAQLRERFALRFQEPDLHAALVSRVAFGKFVIDNEVITRNFSEGKGTLEMLCIYEIESHTIVRASFVTGEKRLDAA